MPVPPHIFSESKTGSTYLEFRDGIHKNPISARVEGWNFTIPPQQNALRSGSESKWLKVRLEGQGWVDLDKGLLVYKLTGNDCEVELKLPKG